MSGAAKFCGYCGQPLENGMCNCEQYIDKIAPSKKYERERNIKLNTAAYITNPVLTSIKHGDQNKVISPLFLGILHIIIVYACLMVVSENNPLSIIISVIVIAANLSAAVAAWMFGLLLGSKHNFSTYLAKFCIATIPSTVFIILACASFFLFWPCCIVFSATAAISWLSIAVIFLRETYEVRETLLFWSYIGIISIVIFILLALGTFLNDQIINTISHTNLINLFI